VNALIAYQAENETYFHLDDNVFNNIIYHNI